MSDIISRAQRAAKVVEDLSIAPAQRVSQALETLSGLMLSDINEFVRPA